VRPPRPLPEPDVELSLVTVEERSASTTRCPTVTPVSTWVCTGSITPRVTTTGFSVAPLRTSTMCRVPNVCTAEVGTTTALEICPVVSRTDADIPWRRPGADAGRPSVTG
jgi:hypothetical protein